MVYTLVLGTSAERREGSSPFIPTIFMNTFERPVTGEVHRQEKFALPAAQEAFDEFLRTSIPVILWQQHHRSDESHIRAIELSEEETHATILNILDICGTSEDFYESVRILKEETGLPSSELVALEKNVFGEHKPAFYQIFNWLGDKHSFLREEPNDFTVGLAIEAPQAIVVVKCTSSEPFEYEYDETDPHYEPKITVEENYSISVYPKAMVDEINWGEVSQFNNCP